MDMTSLFPNEDAVASTMAAADQPHVQFKAGRMTHDTTTNVVTADPRKGMLQIITSPEDTLPHLQWRPRPGAAVETDLIIIPGDSIMKRVRSSPGRVYVLKWNDTNTRMFFWMQSGDESQDDALIAEINSILELGPQQHTSRIPSLPPQPPVPPPRLRIPDTPESSSVPDATGTVPRAPASATTAPPSASPAPTSAQATALTLESFGRMLDALPSVANPDTADSIRRTMLTQPTVQDLLRSAEFDTALRTPEVQAALPGLFEHLPEEERSVEAVSELMRSPQVLTQAAALSRALNAGQGAALLRSLGLEEADAGVGVNALLAALKKVQRRK